jgi:hypothetical protein
VNFVSFFYMTFPQLHILSRGASNASYTLQV